MEPSVPPKMMLKEEVENKIKICVSRFMFRHRNQKPEETVLEYAEELRRLAKGCKFNEVCVPESDEVGEKYFPTNYYSETIRRHLFGPSLLTFENALKVAVAKEAADMEVVEEAMEEAKAVSKKSLGAVKKTTASTSAAKGNGPGKNTGKNKQRHNGSQRPSFNPREFQ